MSYAGVFKSVGTAQHVLAAFGQAQPQADAAPQAPQKPIANRKHLNVTVGPLRMHIPVSGKRPVAPAAPANGSTAASVPTSLMHPVQQPLGQPAETQQVQPTPGGSGAVTPPRSDMGIASGGVHRQASPGAAVKANTPIITKDVDELPATSNQANGVVIVNTKKGVGGQPAAVDLENGELKQNPQYVRAGDNPATGTNANPQTRSDAIKANTPILEGSDVHVRKSSGTPPIEYMKANTPIITKDVGDDETRIQNPVLDGHSIKANQPILTKNVDEQPAASGAGAASRSMTAPRSGPVKPQPPDNPITAINITLPANPDAAKKVNPASGGPPAIEQTLNQNGKVSRPESRTVTTDKLQGPEGAGVQSQPEPLTAPLPTQPKGITASANSSSASGTKNAVIPNHPSPSPPKSASYQPPQIIFPADGTEMKTAVNRNRSVPQPHTSPKPMSKPKSK
jgi:hypothetical protein